MALALKTVQYATLCVHQGERQLALDVTSDSEALSLEQQEALVRIVSELQTAPRTVKEVRNFENRMMSVVNAAMWEVLQNQGLVARILSCTATCLNPILRNKGEIERLGLSLAQTSQTSLVKRVYLSALASQRFLCSLDAYAYYKQAQKFADPNISWVQFFAFFPELETFQIRNRDDINEFAQGIKTSCRKFHGLIFATYLDSSAILPFKELVRKLVWQAYPYTSADLEALSTFPHLTDLELSGLTPLRKPQEMDDSVPANVEVLKKFKKLERLTINLDVKKELKEKFVDVISQMPLKYLNITYGFLGDSSLAKLKQMPNLEEINLTKWFVSDFAISDFILAKKGTLKRVFANDYSRNIDINF